MFLKKQGDKNLNPIIGKMCQRLWALRESRGVEPVKSPPKRVGTPAAHWLTKTTRTSSVRYAPALLITSKHGRNCKDLPVAFGEQAVSITATSQGAKVYPHSDISHFNLCRREVRRSQMSQIQQCHPRTENVFPLLFIKMMHHKSIYCLPARLGDQIKH